jgi:prepilin-type N-terminal cleavage/methylation domain-containing protein
MRKKGFTLIELLVVIAIIGVLASIIMAAVSANTRAKSRDARREHDMKTLQDALALYATDTRLYPVCTSEVIINGANDTAGNCGAATGVAQALINAGALSRTPADPMGGVSGTCGGAGSYVYCYQSANGTTYTIRYALETNTIKGKTAGWQTVNP